MIPKVIHYCWFGRKPLPKSARRCVASWREYLPDYEIVRWDEDNYDVNKTAYTREAYAAKKYAFVSDYARFDILYRHGGMYFDTDVEVVRPMDDILARGAFMGCEIDGGGSPGIAVAPGLGMAAEPGMDVYRQILDYYEGLRYLQPDGSPLPATVVKHTTEVLLQCGLQNASGIQRVGGVTVYPAEYFNPYDDPTGRLRITDNTRAIHWFTKSWLPRHIRCRARVTRVFHRAFGVDFFARIKR